MTTFQPETAPGEPPPARLGATARLDRRRRRPRSSASTRRSAASSRTWGSVWVEGEITGWNLRGGNVFGRLKDLGTDATISFRIWSSTRERLPARPQGRRPRHRVRQGRLLRQDRRLQLRRLRDAPRRTRRPARAARAPARRSCAPRASSTRRARSRSPSSRTSSASSPARNRMPRRTCTATPSCAGRRCGSAPSYAAVQGDRCVPETIAALKALDADPDVDVIVIARGGGDPQTLLGFSDERLLRAVAAASTPVVSAIGHENDHPLLDDVADLRASTPTDAAKRVVPDVAEQRALVAQLRARLTSRLTQRVTHDIAQLEQLRSRPVLRTPETHAHAPLARGVPAGRARPRPRRPGARDAARAAPPSCARRCAPSRPRRRSRAATRSRTSPTA